MDSLLAFIPEDRRLALVEGRVLPDRAQGCVIFADISGFTPLTAALALELGVQRGAEEVLNQINPVYEALIAELHRYGGSVMGFAGDSITCWLEGDNGTRGVACALAMQKAMQPFSTVRTPAGTSISLAIKVAVAAGSTRRFVVGDPDIQLIDVLAGRTLDHVASAEKTADKGEIVVGEEVVTALGEACEVLEWRTKGDAERFAVVTALHAQPDFLPHLYLNPDVLPVEQVKAWVLPPVYSRLLSGGKYLAELRPTVALFLKFSGIDYDEDEAAGRKLDAYVRWIQTTLQKQEGFLIQLTIGDKGSYAYASFGAPVAHDDDSVRAVAAARELLSPPAELSFIHDTRIGISRGRVWAGECGARARHTYGVMGNEVNMAARLMGNAASGQILVRRRVADEARQAFQFRQLGLMTVKGGSEPIPVSEVVGRQRAPALLSNQFEMPLVGRDSELGQLERIMDTALAGHGQLVTLEGPTGIGKSHLMAVFQQLASANGLQVAVGACQRIAQTTTYYPWQQILRQIFGLNSAAGEETGESGQAASAAAVESALVQMNPSWQIRAPLLGDLLGLPIPDNPTTEAFDPKQRQESLFAFVIEIVRMWARSQPLVLVFENAHWLDDISRVLIEALAKAARDMPLIVGVITRPASEIGPRAEDLAGFRNHPNHYLISLKELGGGEIGQLITDILGGPPSPLARLLIESKAQGNPFFTRELVDALRESQQLIENEGEWGLSPGMINALRAANALVREEGTWVLAESADLSSVSLGIPDSVHGVILARLDRLPDTHKPTIKVASVIGYSFELGLLAQVHPSHPTRELLRDQAHILEERDFIFQDWDSASGAERDIYTFRQQATQEVSYETLLYTQRRELHRNLAELLEDQSPEAIDQIAYHAYLGEDWERAMRCHLLAGTLDKQLFANLQSIEHYRKALVASEHLSPDETLVQRQKIHADLGELLITIGRYDEGQDHLLTALPLAERLEDVEAQAHVARWIARTYELRGQYDPALEWIDRGLTLLGNRLTPSALELRLIAGLIYSRQGDYRRASQQARASLLAADELQHPSIIARAHNLLGNIDRNRGHLTDAATHFEESLGLYREIGNLQGQALAQNSLATAYFDLGRWSDADRFYREAGRSFSQLGDVYNRLLVDNNLGGIALNQGRLDDALHFYRRALQVLEETGGSLWVLGALHLNLGATHVRRNEPGVALEHLNKSHDLFEKATIRDLLPEMHRWMSEAFLALQDLEQARREATYSLSLAGELSVMGEQGLALHQLGKVAAAQERNSEAEQHYLRALELLKQVGDDYGLSCVQLSLAELDHDVGNPDRRDELLSAAFPVFRRLGATLELERAQKLLGHTFPIPN